MSGFGPRRRNKPSRPARGRNCGIFGIAASRTAPDTAGMTQSTTRHMAVLAYPDVQILDVVGPLQVFASAGCTVEVIGLEPGPFRTSSGIQLVAERGFAQVHGGIDTLLVAGGQGSVPTSANP